MGPKLYFFFYSPQYFLARKQAKNKIQPHLPATIVRLKDISWALYDLSNTHCCWYPFGLLVKPVLPENMHVGGKTISSIIDRAVDTSKGGLITPAPRPPHNPSIFLDFRTKRPGKPVYLQNQKLN